MGGGGGPGISVGFVDFFPTLMRKSMRLRRIPHQHDQYVEPF